MYHHSYVKIIALLLLLDFTTATFFPRGNETSNSRETKNKPDNHRTPSSSSSSLREQHAGENCLRPCTIDNAKICYFKFTLEHYHVMGSACSGCRVGQHLNCSHPACVTADGIERGFMSINRRYPGPSIEVCENDTIVVDVENLMAGTATSMHWHGILQEETQFMDGVAHVTQCPIPYFSTFRYQFKARHAGTHHYHSHAGHHKSNGIAGPLIIREPRSRDPNGPFYDYDLSEHTIFLSDWMHTYAEMFVPGLPSTLLLPKSVLINGRARFNKDDPNIPLAVFRVKSGGRYKFRLINSNALTCPLQFQIEKHRMSIIASDANNLKPITVDTLITTSGERYDFILEANQTKGNYWIRVRAIGQCALDSNQIESFAVLTYYTGSEINDTELAFTTAMQPAYEDNFPPGIVINNPNGTCQEANADSICLTDLESYTRDANLLNSIPDHTFQLRFTTPMINNDILFNNDNNKHYSFFNVFGPNNNVGVINNISFYLSQSLIQTNAIKEDLFCDETAKMCETTEICFCLHRIKVKLNAIVEITLKDSSKDWEPIYHPMHLHGHRMVVTEMNSPKFPRNGTIKEYPAYKDTIAVPSQGQVTVRFRANNPGFWMLHCHFEWHLNIGMNVIVQVGELAQMTQIPADFPTCGNYIPEIV
ncbi:uncharacterized protein LOC134828593 [Culicoides brevitarsis]|uniref:uncharacterized protein LOC134828593 n=1 Tax=Culicoides brevitarsis TaxID=469753 RepID=UPI00307B280E